MNSANAPKLQDIFAYLSHLLQVFVPIIGFLAFVMILIAGFKLLTAGSNPENLEKGKKTLTFAIVGLALTVLTWLILTTIAYLTGAKILEFQTTIKP